MKFWRATFQHFWAILLTLSALKREYPSKQNVGSFSAQENFKIILVNILNLLILLLIFQNYFGKLLEIYNKIIF